MVRIQADVGSITPGLITNLVKYFKDNVQPDIIRHQHYAEGKNDYIYQSKNYDPQDKRVSIPSGKNLVENTNNYLFSKRVDYNCEDSDYKAQIVDIQKANSDHEETKLIGWDILSAGEAYKLVYDSGEGEETQVSYARIAPEEGFMVYDYAIKPEPEFFVRFFTKQTFSESVGTETNITYKLYVEVYTRDEVIKFESAKESSSIKMLFADLYNTAVTEQHLEEKDRNPHLFDGVPVVHYMDEHYTGLIYTVIDIIDAIDITATQVSIEVVAYQLCMLLNKGAKFKKDDVIKIKDGRVTVMNIGSEGALEYLIKNVDYQSIINVLNWYIDTLHDVSGVPNFNKKDFSAATGIALAYKLIGYDNVSKTVSSIFTAGEQKALGLYNSILYLGEYVRKGEHFSQSAFLQDNPDCTMTIKINTNIPLDKQSAINLATGMKTVGIDTETILENLPDEIIDDVKKVMDRIEKQMEKNVKQQQALFGAQEKQGQNATADNHTEVQ